MTDTTLTTTHPIHHSSDGWRRFARHYGEMVLAMALGMVVLGTAVELILQPFGTGMHDMGIGVHAAVMTLNMTLPMLAWMHYAHRMPVARMAEMTAAMVVPTVAALILHVVGVLGADGVLLVEHVLMLPAMLAVMLWRRDAYSH